MSKRIAIFCNGAVPGSGIPSGAQGQRALGLYLGLTHHGFEVDIVSRSDAVLKNISRWKVGKIQVPQYWRVLPPRDCDKILNRDYGTVILLNWAGLPEFVKNKKNKLIYDFFSATMIEHSFIVDSAELERRRVRKHAILKQADLFIANGEGRATYATEYLSKYGFLNGSAPVISARLALPWMGQHSPEPDDTLRIFLGGFDQSWVSGMDADYIDQLSSELNATFHLIGFGEHLNIHTWKGRKLPKGDNVINHGLCSFDEYCAINSACDLTLDVFQRNIEREVSFSTRAATAVACGCPVLSMSFTEIGRILSETGAGWNINSFSRAAIADLLSKLGKDRSEIRQARKKAHAFWKDYFSPAEQARELAAALA